MAAGKNLLSRVPNHFVKTITFDGTAGNGATGTVAIATVTGRILITYLSAHCSTTIVTTANGEIELGVASNTAELIAQIADAGDLIATEYWNDATPTQVNAADAIVDKLVAANIILTVSTSPMTAGVIEFSMFWLPLSVDGNLA